MPGCVRIAMRDVPIAPSRRGRVQAPLSMEAHDGLRRASVRHGASACRNLRRCLGTEGRGRSSPSSTPPRTSPDRAESSSARLRLNQCAVHHKMLIRQNPGPARLGQPRRCATSPASSRSRFLVNTVRTQMASRSQPDKAVEAQILVEPRRELPLASHRVQRYNARRSSAR
jgi:hypothetical protein